MKIKIFNKNAELVQTKTVIIILAVLALISAVIFIMQIDLFGYIKNLPSFGEVRSGEESVELEDIASNAGCENYIGGIDNVPLSEYFSSKDLRKFYLAGKGKSRDFIVSMETSLAGPALRYLYGGEDSFDKYIVIGVFDKSMNRFRVAEDFKDLCTDFALKDVPLVKINSINIQNYEKEVYSFSNKPKSCAFLDLLHGAIIFGERVLCKTNAEIQSISSKTATNLIRKKNQQSS